MIPTVDPRKIRLFDPFDDVISPVRRRLLVDGWQGVCRHVLRELRPVGDRAQHFRALARAHLRISSVSKPPMTSTFVITLFANPQPHEPM